MINITSKPGTASGRILLALACAAGLAAPMLAQVSDTAPAAPQQTTPPAGWQGRGGDRQEHQLEHLTKALNLSPDQVSQIKSIETNSHQQMMALRNDTSTAAADKRAKMMSIHQATQTNIRAVLTDEQKTRFDAIEARQRERREEHQEQQGSQPAPTPPPGV
jgi:Spy/CpxP family protein refolding chaperone